MNELTRVGLIAGGTAIGAHLFLRAFGGGGRDIVLPPGEYAWPMPDYDGQHPEVSHEFEPFGIHPGLDLMFRLPQVGVLPPGWSTAPSWSGSKLKWGIPPAMVNVAAHDGVLAFAGTQGTGYTVVIETPDRMAATYYTHMRNGQLGEAGWKAKGEIARGTVLGDVSFNPKDGEQVPHLHFEWWVASSPGKYDGWPKASVDPWPLLKQWPHSQLAELA